MVAAAVGLAALAYASTLLPGVDLGDTASFQTIVTYPLLVPRHAYPLYFALGKAFILLTGAADPARALNALSAIAAVAAVGTFAWLAWELTASRLAALWAALLFAFSYTFWSQAVIAEVYTLEALFIALVFALMVRWWHRPTAGRLAWLYAAYALSFGNHLSMILFAPALVWILWRGRRRAELDPFSGRGIALGAGIAAAGALQYAWNFYGLVALGASHRSPGELMAIFWFDVTKTDWRESLVGTVPVMQWPDRIAMTWWDLRQQFGIAGVGVAILGICALARASRAWAAGLALAWVTTFTFAFLYNVGDTHAFLLPSHQIVAMMAATGAAVIVKMAERMPRSRRVIVLVLFCAVPLWRGIDTWPAVDRSGDTRPGELAAAAIRGIDPARAVFVADMNWQVQNAVGYQIVTRRPELPHVFSSSVLWHFPEFVRRNHALGRDVLLTTPAASTIRAVYGERFTMSIDPRSPGSTLADAPPAPAGTPYVLVLLTPLPEATFDRDRIARLAQALGGEKLPVGRYVLLAGLAGSPPLLKTGTNRPFDVTARLPFGRVRVRIDAWVPFDTMRRAGFGHVIVNGRHAVTIERGATFAAFAADGRVLAHAYEGGSFSLQPRHVIPVLE